MGGGRFLSAFCMMVRCRWPSGERHRTVMQMLRSFGLPCARQGVSHLFGGTVFVCPVLRGIRPSQIPGSPPPRFPPTRESQYLGSAKWERLKGRNGNLSKILADLVLDLQGKWVGPAETCRKPQETAEIAGSSFDPFLLFSLSYS